MSDEDALLRSILDARDVDWLHLQRRPMEDASFIDQMEQLRWALTCLTERRQQPFEYEQRAADVRDAQHVLREAFEFRQSHAGLPEPYALWEAAARVFHDAVVAAYPPGFWESYDRLKAGDPSGLEAAVRFMEADPWFFRAGYIKARLIRYIKRLDLSPQVASRLRGVVLAAVDGGSRGEWRNYCRLARKLDGPALRAALRERLASPDPQTRWHAECVMDACQQGLSPIKYRKPPA